MKDFNIDFFGWMAEGGDNTPYVRPVTDNQDDFLDDATISATILAQDISADLDYTPSHREVEDKKFDPIAYWVWKIAKDDPALKDKATRKIYSQVTVLIHKGKDEDEILAAVKDSVEFMGIAGKHEMKTLTKIISNIQSWIYQANCVFVFYNLLGWVHIGIKSRRIQKENKKLQPLVLAMVALQQAKDCNQHGLMSLAYTEAISLELAENVLEEKHLTRKYEAYAKNEYISYLKGKRHGIATRVGMKDFTGELSVADKHSAADLILTFFKDTEVSRLLAVVLHEVAKIDGKPGYDNCDLGNKIDDLIKAYKVISLKVGEDRRFVRLAESVDFENARKEEEAARTAKVTQVLASGGLFKASESHAKPLEAEVNTSVAVMEKPVEKASEPVTLAPFTPEWYVQKERENYERFLNMDMEIDF